MSSPLTYSSRYLETLLRTVSPTKLDIQSVLASIKSATAAVSAGPLDHFYARLGSLNGPFFPAGWGNLSVVNYEEDLRHLIAGPPSNIKLSWRLVERGRRKGTDYVLYEGTFRTPCLQRVFDALPPESRTGRVQLLMPAHLKPFEPVSDFLETSDTIPQHPPHSAVDLAAASSCAASFASYAGTASNCDTTETALAQEEGSAAVRLCRSQAPPSPPFRLGPTSTSFSSDAPACVIHLAATGDQTFGRRLRLGFPLLKDNVCSLVLESPFYGARRPAAQRGSKLLRVSDLLTLGWATISESLNLLHWLKEQGYGPQGICGLSMGGVHASMTAGLFPGDVAVTPLLAPRSAAVAYCDGAMRAAMAWEPFLKDVDENNNRISQVVMAAGRAVRVEIPVAAVAGGAAGAAPAPDSPQKVVALMREATYALADLEVCGEKRHLAAHSPSTAAEHRPACELTQGTGLEATELRNVWPSRPSGGGDGFVSTGTAAQVSRWDEVVRVKLTDSAALAGGVNGASGGGGISAFQGTPYVSVMDVQRGLAQEFLWDSPHGAGSSGGSGAAAAHPQPSSASHMRALDRPPTGPGVAAPRTAVSAGPQDDHRGTLGGEVSGAPRAERLAKGPQGLHHPHDHPHRDCNDSQDPTQHQQQRHHRHHTYPAAVAPPLPLPEVVVATSTDTNAPPGRQPDAPVPITIPHVHEGATAAEAHCDSEGDAGKVSFGGGGTVIGRRLLGDLGRAVKKLRADDRRLDRPETVLRLKQVLETYTDITRYPRPRRTDAAVMVAAQDDAYVSRESVQQLHRYWGGSELRMVSGGHVSAFVMHQEAFRGAIRDSLRRVARPAPHAAAPPPQG